MVNLNCFFLLSLIAYFYLKLTEDLFTIASGRMIKKKISPGRYAGNNDIFYFGLTTSSDDNDNSGSKTCYMNDLNIAQEKCSQLRKNINTSHSEALIILQTSKLKVSDFFKK